MNCRICDNDRENIIHEFREVMFGMGDKFPYLECSSCRTIQLCEIPDLAKYYPEEYCSFDLDHFEPKRGWVRDLLIRRTARYFLNGKDPIGRVAAAARPSLGTQFPASLRINLPGLNLRSRILDVGCGSGGLLITLSHFGFERLKGADPFIAEPVRGDGVVIDKCGIEGVSGQFDLVMFHHSLEHIVDPVSALQSAHSLLDDGAFCLVRIPVISRAWETYGVNWSQLDAPRHVSLFTERGFQMAAEKTGFKLERVVYDSTSFQFWGSEQILRGLPVQDGILGGAAYLQKAFDGKMEAWEKMARELNARGEGDQACFYLRRN